MGTPPPTTTARRRNRRGATVLAAGAAALTLGLGACAGTQAGATGDERTPLQVVSDSLEKSTAAETARFALTLDAAADGENGTVTAEGSFDAEAEAVQAAVTIDVPDARGLTPQVRVVDGQVYVSGLPGTAEGQWVQVPADHLHTTGPDTHGIDTHGMDTHGIDTGVLDPAAQLELLRAVSGEVREVGTETVRGVRATGYAGEIDLHEALELATTPEERAHAQRHLDDSGLRQLPFVLYVDAEDHPVRLVLNAAVDHEEKSATATVTVDTYDWGEPVTITAPPAGSIVQPPQGLHELPEGHGGPTAA